MYTQLATVIVQVRIPPEASREMDEIMDEVTASCEAAAMEYGEVVAASFVLGSSTTQGVEPLPGDDEDVDSDSGSPPPSVTVTSPAEAMMLPEPMMHSVDRQERVLAMLGLELDEV